jgi:hypothetical protein
MTINKLETRENIYIEAKNFRKAILKVPTGDFRFCLFRSYPKNCCEYTSLLLAKYLIECQKYKDIKILRGENKYKTSIRHVWLKVNDIDVDITAYQFSSTNKTVITENSSEWHQKRYRIFETELPNIEFKGFHNHSTEWLLNDYRLILQNLKSIGNLHHD